MKRLIPVLIALSAVVPASMYAKTAKPVTLSEAVRHSLAMTPRYSVFDDLKFQVSGGTVILNGQKIIDNQPILGCTGGALTSDELKPGPLFLQGDHTSIDYRNIVLRPVIK